MQRKTQLSAKPNAFADAPAAIAKRFGVSAKALRVYERLGLIAPARTEAGWRAYGRADIERLAAIVALKQLGLPLKRIATLLEGRADLAAVLALQEAALEDAKAANEEALSLVRAARRRLAEHDALSTDELANLIRRSKMSEFKWTPKMESLAQKHYTQEQLSDLKSRSFTDADQARVSAAWASVYADVEALGDGADPASEKALAIGRRANALIQEFTQGDPSMFKAVTGMKRDMAQDAEIAKQMPAPSTMNLLGRIFGELVKRGEMKGA
jgi:MerR family transcriptional regulator, thiopeptide resistance regulator